MSRPKTPAPMLLVCVLGVPLLTAMCGCGQAVRFLRETPNGGTITMPINTNRWPTYYRAQAMILMEKKCPDGYRIDREAAVGVGLGNPADHSAYESYFGYTGGSEAEQEYRITFHGVSAKKPSPPKAASPRTDQRDPSTRPPTKPAEEGMEELPTPRRVAPSSEREK